MEIGSPAINILIDTWEGHLTPQEVASLADRASRCRDASMVRAAAELALSCLPHAQVNILGAFNDRCDCVLVWVRYNIIEINYPI